MFLLSICRSMIHANSILGKRVALNRTRTYNFNTRVFLKSGNLKTFSKMKNTTLIMRQLILAKQRRNGPTASRQNVICTKNIKAAKVGRLFVSFSVYFQRDSCRNLNITNAVKKTHERNKLLRSSLWEISWYGYN